MDGLGMVQKEMAMDEEQKNESKRRSNELRKKVEELLPSYTVGETTSALSGILIILMHETEAPIDLLIEMLKSGDALLKAMLARDSDRTS